MVEDAHEDDEVELFAELADIVSRHLAEFDVQSVDVSRELRLLKIFIVGVETEHTICTPSLHFHGVETSIAADIENRLAIQSFWNDPGKATPFHPRIVAQEVRRRGTDAVEIEVVEPRAERIHASANFLSREGAAHEVTPVAAC